ncbi:MAG: hypothetical protein GF329_14190 [Candidatus Lokiarchaeota archaeon]|nr:hypothetical protein [Candidatus Lokiarchaeota archaeon]
MNLSELEFPAHNAIFHITKGLLFNRNISFRVSFLYDDQNGRNITIKNKERLKQRLFEKIQMEYNRRLDARSEPSDYQFTEEFKEKMRIYKDDIDNFTIKQFQLTKGMEEEYGLSNFGGYYSVFPRTFYCDECGDVQYLSRKTIRGFNPNRCKRSGCKGKYRQLSIMMYCETCGNVRPFFYTYKDYPITLLQPSSDSIATWKVKAETPDRDYIDVFRLNCKHKDPYDYGPYMYRKVISDAEPKGMRPLTVTEGSIFIPVATSSIDIPTSPDINIADLEYILLGIGLKKLDFLESMGLSINLKTIQDLYQAYHNEAIKKVTFKTDPNFIGKSNQEKEKLWRKKYFIDKIENSVEELKEVYIDKEALRELNDFTALLGKLGVEKINTISYNEYIDSIRDEVNKSSKKSEFNSIRNIYFIDDIIYVPKVTLINSCYGIYNGINKFYEPGFVPHFEPLWKKGSDPKEGFEANSYPYNTEGIIITLSKKKIIDWLHDCNIIHNVPNNNNRERNNFFSSMKEDSPEYQATKQLLHTLSHLLMRNSSLYTGLDLQSYGEKIFPTSTAIFLFTTSSINIGGLQFIFENEVFNCFENMKFDVKECTLDPNCISESGACFSCMYVPEFVCGYFNKDLDRDVFIGKHRFKEGFWC